MKIYFSYLKLPIQGDMKFWIINNPIFQKIAQQVSNSKKRQNICNKTEIESSKYLHRTTFETIKYLQQTMF
jgi:hypothetical protein